MLIDDNRDDIYDLMGYMSSAAKELLSDPQIYGPFRMVDSMSRMIEFLNKNGLADDFLIEIRNFIEENKYSVTTDENDFSDFLNKLVLKFVEISSL